MNAKELKNFILDKQKEKGIVGTFFSILAIKKNGEERLFYGNFNYKKYCKGGKPAYDAEEKNLLLMLDMNARFKFKKGETSSPIRCVYCGGKKRVRFGKETYIIE